VTGKITAFLNTHGGKETEQTILTCICDMKDIINTDGKENACVNVPDEVRLLKRI
jgi:hypothetical protein